MNNVIHKINESNWSDFVLGMVNIDFETVEIDIIGDEGEKEYQLSCCDYIGFEKVGHWDENIIDTIVIDEYGDLMFRSQNIIEKNYGNPPVSGGGTKLVNDKWYQLNIKFIDKSQFSIVCKRIKIK